MDGLFRLGLAWSLALLIGLLAPHAGAADVVSVGGEWLLSIDSLHQGGATQLQGSTGVRLQGRTLTYPWRGFFDGRVMGMGPLDGKWSSDSRLDRLYLRLYLPAADVTIGKQAVNWGSGYVWSPTDLFSPPDPDELGGVRKGVTAAVVQLPVGPLDYWSVAVADEKLGVRRRGNVSGVDWSLLTVRDHGDIVIGGDLKGGRGIGWRLAGTYRLPDEPDAAQHLSGGFRRRRQLALGRPAMDRRVLDGKGRGRRAERSPLSAVDLST